MTHLEPQWKVMAWIMPPGDFPGRVLRAGWVRAPDIVAAIKEAHSHFLKFGIEPITVVSAVRESPPAGTP